MLIKTILNRIEKHACFVYGACRLLEERGRLIIEMEIKARAHSQPICSGCGERRPGYDKLPLRRFEFVPLWGIAVFFLYAMRRVNCCTCGVKVVNGKVKVYQFRELKSVPPPNQDGSCLSW